MTYWMHCLRLRLIQLRLTWHEAARADYRQRVSYANFRIDRLEAEHMEVNRKLTRMEVAP